MDIEIMGEIRRKRPLIHCITNYVTANDVANIILAAGGCAVMADGEREVEDIVSISQGLVINMGTLKEGTIPAMIKAGKRANELGIPVVFDPVGAGASRFRTEACRKVFEQVKVSLARGNSSEIKALAKALEENGRPQAPTPEAGRTKGVDVSEKDRLTEENLQKKYHICRRLCKKTWYNMFNDREHRYSHRRRSDVPGGKRNSHDGRDHWRRLYAGRPCSSFPRGERSGGRRFYGCSGCGGGRILRPAGRREDPGTKKTVSCLSGRNRELSDLPDRRDQLPYR